MLLFGSMFDNLHVLRTNSSGKVLSQVKVPLSYAFLRVHSLRD